ncbi:hypothetical protein [Nonomuraea sp. NPDC005650]|uniref:hypothetical protein n=1 Tax=Nonomuraea sp. NPDC005650 TaxID=3157045 RepID=UPI0033AFDB77
MRDELSVDVSSLRADSAATLRHGTEYATSSGSLHGVGADSWGDDLLTASFLREHLNAVSLAAEVHDRLAGLMTDVGANLAGMANTAVAADEAAISAVPPATGGETWV